jgi:hypothetical protein
MIEWFAAFQIGLALVVSLTLLVFGLAKRKPSLVSLSLIATVEAGLIVQTLVSVVLVINGERAKTDTIEFFAYLFVALLIPAGGAIWALIERNRWSTMVLAVAAATVAVMLARMQQIWQGF